MHIYENNKFQYVGYDLRFVHANRKVLASCVRTQKNG